MYSRFIASLAHWGRLVETLQQFYSAFPIFTSYFTSLKRKKSTIYQRFVALNCIRMLNICLSFPIQLETKLSNRILVVFVLHRKGILLGHSEITCFQQEWPFRPQAEYKRCNSCLVTQRLVVRISPH